MNENVETRVSFKFTASEAFQRKLDKVKALAWHRLPANTSLDPVFELMMDFYLERHDPVRRREARQRRARQRDATTGVTARSRRVPAAVRDDVYARDGGRCRYVGADGRRCSATAGLQIDHIEPVAHGGTCATSNLRLLCAQHNRFEAERMGLGRGG